MAIRIINPKDVKVYLSDGRYIGELRNVEIKEELNENDAYFCINRGCCKSFSFDWFYNNTRALIELFANIKNYQKPRKSKRYIKNRRGYLHD